MRNALAGTRLAQVRWVTSTGSTNADLAKLARSGAGEQVLIADEQTAGRGRRGRVWEAPAESGVLMSVLLRQVAPSDAFWLVGAIALAACQVIDELTVVPCRLKWPNDVLLGPPDDQKKVAGVLAELVDDAAIVGIGINVNWPAHVPVEMASAGTAINRFLSQPYGGSDAQVARPDLAAQVLRRAIGHLGADRGVLRTQWKEHCATIGTPVRLERVAPPRSATGEGSPSEESPEIASNSVEIRGVACDVTKDGALVLEHDGTRTTHHVGDVVHLRSLT